MARKNIRNAPSWPEHQAAFDAHVEAVKEYGAQSEEAALAAKARMATQFKCLEEVGFRIPQEVMDSSDE